MCAWCPTVKIDPSCHDVPGPPTATVDADPTPFVVLVGPPNSGKSTLFNRLTGLRQKVANYPGVTVEQHSGRVRLGDGAEIDLVDLPGVSGFSARSLDEKVTRDVLQGRGPRSRAPDGVVLIVDVTRFEQQLMLCEPTLELGIPTLLVLNMSDELAERGGSINSDALAKELGVEVVSASARKGIGIGPIIDFLREVHTRGPLSDRVSPVVSGRGVELPTVDVYARRRDLVRELSLKAAFQPAGPSRLSEALDGVLLHRLWGPLVFLTVVLLVFQAIFTWATPLMDGTESIIASSGLWVGSFLPDTWFRSLLISGVWTGVGSVLVFLPQILILFLFLGILEDSGYMARAAVIADRMMARVGLQGRAFLPLLSAYACAVPAILSARTVEDERDRMATIFVAPFMTCSARLPVYALLIAAFVPQRPLLGPLMGTRSATLLGLYALGALAAVVTAFALKRTLLKGRQSSFLMELPSYRVPSLRSLLLRLLDRAKVFLRRAGTVIFAVTVVLWVLTQFPRVNGAEPPIAESVLGRAGHLMEPAIRPLGFDWKVGIGLVSSLAAREVIVGTLGAIHGIEEADQVSMQLQDALKEDLDLGGAVALLVFFAFALQCMSTVAVMRRETGGWRWPALQFSYMLLLAYVGAFLANWLI